MRKRKKVKKHKDSITIKAPFLMLPSNKGSKKEPVWLTHDYLPQLIELIKLQIQGDSTENIESGLGLYNKRPLPPKGLGSQTWLMIIAILVLITILFILMKNKNTVYLKPKAQNEGTAEQGLPQQEQRQTPTQANTNEEVQKAELQALRQTAVTMTVAEKGGANQIVKDWMDDSNKEAEETAD